MGTTAESDNSNPGSPRKRRRSNRQKHSFRVLLCDSIDQAGADILSSIAEVDSRGKVREEELLKIIGDYHAILVRSGTSVSEKVINQGKQLKIIGRAGVGVDNVCVDAATAKGIFVVNSPQGNTVAAAELTLGLMMALARRIPQADASVARGEWKRNLFVGRQLQQKTIGIIGLGQVGTHVARVCQALGMHVLAYDPFITEAKAKAAGCALAADLPELLSASDVVTLHVPLLDATRHLINRKTLELTKKGVFLINASRGAVVDEEALAEALAKDHVGGAALDVYEKEGEMHADHPLLKVKNLGKNVIFTPHIGASTAEAQHNVAVDVALQVKATLLGGTPSHAINLQVVQSQHLKEHLLVADILGRLCSRLVEQPVQQLHLRLRGEAATLKNGDADALLLAAAQGMLRTRCDGVVNFVNVKRVAQEHRLQLVVSREAENSGPRELLIEVTLHTAAEAATVSGCSSSARGGVVLKSFLGTVIDLPIPIACEGSSSSNRSCSSSYSSVTTTTTSTTPATSTAGLLRRRASGLHATATGRAPGATSNSNAHHAKDEEERSAAADAAAARGGEEGGGATLAAKRPQQQQQKAERTGGRLCEVDGKGGATAAAADGDDDEEAARTAGKEVEEEQRGDYGGGRKAGLEVGGGDEAEEEAEEDEEQSKDGLAVYMMYTLHRDQPGTLASVAQLLAEAGVNVANCHLGRRPISPSDIEREEKARQELKKIERKDKDSGEELLEAPAGHYHQSAATTTTPGSKCGIGTGGEEGGPAAAGAREKTELATKEETGRENGAAAAETAAAEIAGAAGMSRLASGTTAAAAGGNRGTGGGGERTMREEKIDNWMGLCIFLADNEIKEEVVEKIRALRRVHDCKVFATPQTLGAGRHTLP